MGLSGTLQASVPEVPHPPSQAAHILFLAMLSWFPDLLRWYWGLRLSELAVGASSPWVLPGVTRTWRLRASSWKSLTC